jgi:hypothetical protein
MKISQVLIFIITFILATGLIYCSYLYSFHEFPGRFTEEQIYINISEGKMSVTGIYTYENGGKIIWIPHLFYPFPEGRVTSWKVREEGGEKTPWLRVEPVFTGQELRYSLSPFSPGEKRKVIVNYCQEVCHNRGLYITKTTRTWKRAVKNAQFFINLPLRWSLKDCSYEVTKNYIEKDRKIYFIEINDFYPEEDLIVSWNEHTADFLNFYNYDIIIKEE